MTPVAGVRALFRRGGRRAGAAAAGLAQALALVLVPLLCFLPQPWPADAQRSWLAAVLWCAAQDALVNEPLV
eukprot:gene42288-10055_t